MQVLVVEHGWVFVFFDHIVFVYLFVTNDWRAHNSSAIYFDQRIVMNLQIQAQNFILTKGLRHHVASRLAYALNHGRDIVMRIVVRLRTIP